MGVGDPRRTTLRKRVVKTQIALGTGLFVLGIGLSVFGVIDEGVRISVGSLLVLFAAIPTWPWGGYGLLEVLTSYNFESMVFAWIVALYGVYMILTALV